MFGISAARFRLGHKKSPAGAGQVPVGATFCQQENYSPVRATAASNVARSWP